jgi:hypothetical protein
MALIESGALARIGERLELAQDRVVGSGLVVPVAKIAVIEN